MFKVVLPAQKEEEQQQDAVLEDHLAEIVDCESEEFEQARNKFFFSIFRFVNQYTARVFIKHVGIYIFLNF